MAAAPRLVRLGSGELEPRRRHSTHCIGPGGFFEPAHARGASWLPIQRSRGASVGCAGSVRLGEGVDVAPLPAWRQEVAALCLYLRWASPPVRDVLRVA